MEQNETKCQAECLRLALIAGLVDRRAVMLWVDARIHESSSPHPALIDLAYAANRPPHEIEHLLGACPGDCDRERSSGLFLALALNSFESGETASSLIRALSRTWQDEGLTAQVAAEIDRLDDELSLAETGTHGTLETVTRELSEFLEPFRRPLAAGLLPSRQA